MKIPYKLFIHLFLILLMAISIPLLFFVPIKLAIIISLFFSVIGCLFAIGFVQREMKQDTLIITSGKKKKEVPMSWYENQIREQLRFMRFEFHEKRNETEYYLPTGLYNVFETQVQLEVSPYIVKVIGSRLFIRIISDIAEIKSEGSS